METFGDRTPECASGWGRRSLHADTSLDRKRIWLASSLLWLAIFVGLTGYSIQGGVTGYSGGEWWASAGTPDWFGNAGIDPSEPYPGAIKAIFHGSFPGINWGRLLIAMCVAWFPVQILLLLYWLVSRRLRYHLITIIGVSLTVMVLGMANYWQTTQYGSGAWGWPLNNREEYSAVETAWCDLSVAGTLIFLVGVCIEAIAVCRRSTPLTQAPPPKSQETP